MKKNQSTDEQLKQIEEKINDYKIDTNWKTFLSNCDKLYEINKMFLNWDADIKIAEYLLKNDKFNSIPLQRGFEE